MVIRVIIGSNIELREGYNGAIRAYTHTPVKAIYIYIYIHRQRQRVTDTRDRKGWKPGYTSIQSIHVYIHINPTMHH